MQHDWTGWLARWSDAGLIDADTAARIRAFEGRPSEATRLRWPILIALAFGGLMICGGILLFVAANWDALSPAVRFTLVVVMVAAFHVAGAATAGRFPAMSETMHAVGTAVLGGGIALAGQIFNLEEHWPGGIMLWALGAGCAWALLRQPSQIALFAALAPAWLASEWIVAVDKNDLNESVWVLLSGVFLLAITYLTAVGPGKASRTRRTLLWLGAVAFAASAAGLALAPREYNYFLTKSPLARTTAALGWTVAVAGPLLLAAWLRRRDAWANVLAAAWVVVLFFMRHSGVNVSAYAWWALGAVGLAAWGVRDRRAERINLGAMLFAATVLAFYFSAVMDKLGRSASLVGLGALFLGGGWALERVRRRLVAQSQEQA